MGCGASTPSPAKRYEPPASPPADARGPDPSAWTWEEVVSFLLDKGIPEHVVSRIKGKTGKELLELTERDLELLGIATVHRRRSILRAVEDLAVPGADMVRTTTNGVVIMKEEQAKSDSAAASNAEEARMGIANKNQQAAFSNDSAKEAEGVGPGQSAAPPPVDIDAKATAEAAAGGGGEVKAAGGGGEVKAAGGGGEVKAGAGTAAMDGLLALGKRMPALVVTCALTHELLGALGEARGSSPACAELCATLESLQGIMELSEGKFDGGRLLLVHKLQAFCQEALRFVKGCDAKGGIAKALAGADGVDAERMDELKNQGARRKADLAAVIKLRMDGYVLEMGEGDEFSCIKYSMYEGLCGEGVPLPVLWRARFPAQGSAEGATFRAAILEDLAGFFGELFASNPEAKVDGVIMRVSGDEGPGVGMGRSLSDLAVVYMVKGKHAEAEQLYLRALAIKEETLGADHIDVAWACKNLGYFYSKYGKGQSREAEAMYKRALAVEEKALGVEDPGVAGSCNSLAEFYCNDGRWGEAEPLYQRALAVQEKALGPDHPDVAAAARTLGVFFENQKRYPEAEPLYVRALGSREKILGPNHPDVGESCNDVADVMEAQGRKDEAQPLRERAQGCSGESLSDDDSDGYEWTPPPSPGPAGGA